MAAADGRTTVLVDNLPGQPYVLVRQNGDWHEPSGTAEFGSPLPTAWPTSLVSDDGQLVMSVQLFDPGQVLGNDESSVALLTSTDGVSWQTSNVDAFQNGTVNQLLPVPAGLLAVGSRTVGQPDRPAYPWTEAFASLSPDGGITWPYEPINPASLGNPPPTGPTTTTTIPTTTTGTGATSTATSSGRSSSVSTTSTTSRSGSTTTSAPSAATTTTNPAATTTTTTEPRVEAPLAGPFTATAAGRLGNSLYVVGQAGPQAVGWFSPDGTTWQRPQVLDATPQLATEQARAGRTS